MRSITNGRMIRGKNKTWRRDKIRRRRMIVEFIEVTKEYDDVVI